MVSPIQRFAPIGFAFVISQMSASAVMAQMVTVETTVASLPSQELPKQISPEDLLPPPDLDNLSPSSTDSGNDSGNSPDSPNPNDAKFQVDRFEFEGNTRFKSEELATVTAAFVGREITFSEMLQARSAITKFYNDAGYVTTGAIITPQTMQDGVVKIQIVEGQLEDIQVSGNTRLRANYIRDRLKPDGDGPLNVPQLLEDLQLLRLDPRIANVSADLQAGVRPGSNLLKVDIQEADTFKTNVTLDNSRSPSVGSFRRKAQFVEANLLGFGDTLSVGYTNTKGSNGWDFSYTLPINSKDGNIWFNYGSTKSNVIERPFTALDIQAKSRYYELGLRQPIVQKPTRELALGLLFSRQESQTELGIDNIGPFPLSPGADAEGRTRVSALRFFQEYTQRSEQHVFALRSQFSFGLPWFGSNINDDAPDSKFFAWRGQGQWLRQLAPDTQFLVKSDIQLAGSSLLPLEQFGLGGQMTVRGYRQDALLTDSGALVSAEFRLPIVRGRRSGNVLQLTPFIDLGTAWNMNGNNTTNNTLVGTGVGLLWKQGNFSARFDWGIPLTRLEGEKRTLQDRGLYFSLNYTPF